jgi:hypothetical protein
MMTGPALIVILDISPLLFNPELFKVTTVAVYTGNLIGI